MSDAHFDRLEEAELATVARALGSVAEPGLLVLLVGPMGAGKTTWTRALAVGLGVNRPDRVRSPTFNICLVHEGPTPLLHIDLFRLGGFDGEAPQAAFEALGLAELVDELTENAVPAAPSADAAVAVIEWADLLWRPTERIPEGPHLWVELSRASESQRDVDVGASDASGQRVVERWLAALR